MINKSSRNSLRRTRAERVRRRVAGTAERPRLVVFRSLNHIYAQVIDDHEGNTLAAASSLDSTLKDQQGSFTERAQKVGELIATRAKEKGIEHVVFDRGGYKFHGRVKALADGARSQGLNF